MGFCQSPEMGVKVGKKNVGHNASKPTFYPLETHFGTLTKTHFSPTLRGVEIVCWKGPWGSPIQHIHRSLFSTFVGAYKTLRSLRKRKTQKSSLKSKEIINKDTGGLSRDRVGGKNLFMCFLRGRSLRGRARNPRTILWRLCQCVFVLRWFLRPDTYIRTCWASNMIQCDGLDYSKMTSVSFFNVIRRPSEVVVSSGSEDAICYLILFEIV